MYSRGTQYPVNAHDAPRAFSNYNAIPLQMAQSSSLESALNDLFIWHFIEIYCIMNQSKENRRENKQHFNVELSVANINYNLCK